MTENKEKFELVTYGEDTPPECEFTTAMEIIKKRILINKVQAEIARQQVMYSEANCRFQNIIIDISKKRIEYINKLNQILEKQLTEYTEERQAACDVIHTDMDNLTEEMASRKKELDTMAQCEETMNKLISNCAYLESTMPQSQLITNVKIKHKKDAPTSYNCATEAAGFGEDLPE